MAEVLVLVEHVDGTVKKVTYELLTLARRLGEPAAVYVGSGVDSAIAGLAEHGATQVYVAAAPELTEHPVAPKAEVLAKLVAEKAPAAVLIASTAEGKEVAARLAIKSGSGIITDAVDVAADGTATQSVFGGATVVKSKVPVGTPIITVRTNSVAPEAAPAAGTRVDVSVELSPAATSARTTDRVVQAKGGPQEFYEKVGFRLTGDYEEGEGEAGQRQRGGKV